MNILGSRLPGARVLDLFAGSGALGLESLSRGAAVAEFVEIAPRSLRALGENIAALGAGDQAIVHRQDALRFTASLAAGDFDIAFADPPYKLGMAQRIAETWLATPFAETLGIEHDAREAMPPGGTLRRYGSTGITFYERE